MIELRTTGIWVKWNSTRHKIPDYAVESGKVRGITVFFARHDVYDNNKYQGKRIGRYGDDYYAHIPYGSGEISSLEFEVSFKINLSSIFYFLLKYFRFSHTRILIGSLDMINMEELKVVLMEMEKVFTCAEVKQHGMCTNTNIQDPYYQVVNVLSHMMEKLMTLEINLIT